jgi:hypothetical protein
MPDEDPDQLLQRIRKQMIAHGSQLPNYTCHEVIDRLGRGAHSTTFVRLDRVELEVAFTGKSELFARTSNEQFQEQPIQSFVPNGTIASAPLGSHVDAIFSRDVAEFKYAGTTKKDGHKTYRYDFRVPQEKSGLLVRHKSAEAFVAFKGTMWVDVDTLDPVQVDLKAEHIPSQLEVTMVEESLHYESLPIGDSIFLLPQHSQLAASDIAGNFSLNDVHLESCRKYTGQSAVKFGGEAAPSESTGSASRQEGSKP